MNIQKLIENYRERGYQFKIDSGDLIINGTEPLTQEMFETLKKNKPEILQTLKSADRVFIAQISQSGLSEKWQDYLFDRVQILTKFEGYSLESARAEVLKMIPHYLGLN